MKYVPINFAIALQPLNWLTIMLMLVIASFAVETVYTFAVSSAATNEESL